MTGALVGLLALVVSAVASDAALLVERGEAAAAHEEWLEARSLAMEALEASDDLEAWQLYLMASEGAGLGPMARAEVLARAEDDRPVLRAWVLAEQIRAEEGELRELEQLAKEHPVAGRIPLASIAWERDEQVAAQALLPRDGGGRQGTRLKLRFAVGMGDARKASTVARGWLKSHPQDPDVLSELWPGHEVPADVGLVQKRILKLLHRHVAGHEDDPLWLYRAVEAFAASGDHLQSRELVSRIEELGLEAPPYRRRWSDGMIQGMGRVLGRQSSDEVPEGSWRETVDLVRARVDQLRADEAYDDAVDAWVALRKESDSFEAAMEHARLLQVLEDEPRALEVALEARRLAAGPTPDDVACLDTAAQAARLADVHGLIAELALALGRVDTAREAVSVAQALDPHARWIALRAQIDVLRGGGPDSGLPPDPRVQAVVDSLVDATRPDVWTARARRHLVEDEVHAAFLSRVVARAYGAGIAQELLDEGWDGVGPVHVVAEAALEAYHAARRDHRERMAEIRAETGKAPILPTAVAPGPGLLLPDWEASDVEGQLLASSQLAGEPYILSLWATWCLPCLHELPALNRAVREDGDEIVAVAISVDERESVFRRRAEAEAWNSITTGWNPDLPTTLGVDGLPTNFAVDAEGRILHVERGYSERGVERLVEAVRDAR